MNAVVESFSHKSHPSEAAIPTPMVEKTPDTEPPYTYECVECAERVTADTQPVECPECGGVMENISKPRM